MKRRIFFIALLMVVVGGLAWLVLRPGEPSYEGKCLTYWLDRWRTTYPTKTLVNGVPDIEFAVETTRATKAVTEEHARAENAVRQIGTNGIPTLLRMLRARNSPFTLKLDALIKKQHFFKSPIFLAADKNVRGSIGFHLLGAEAKSAVPALVGILEENLSPESVGETAAALLSLGPDARPAIPALCRAATDTNFFSRAIIVYALDQIHEEPERVVPVFIQCLSDTNRMVSMYTSLGLANLGPGAKQAVPELVKTLQDTNLGVRIQAADALRKIDPDGTARAAVK